MMSMYLFTSYAHGLVEFWRHSLVQLNCVTLFPVYFTMFTFLTLFSANARKYYSCNVTFA